MITNDRQTSLTSVVLAMTRSFSVTVDRKSLKETFLDISSSPPTDCHSLELQQSLQSFPSTVAADGGFL